jgi:hypothetical protein
LGINPTKKKEKGTSKKKEWLKKSNEIKILANQMLMKRKEN